MVATILFRRLNPLIYSIKISLEVPQGTSSATGPFIAAGDETVIIHEDLRMCP